MTEQKVAVVGSRTFTDYYVLEKVLEDYEINIIISGGAKGADALAERYASSHNIQLRVYPADWKTHGKKAGYLRNQEIVIDCDILVAFWDGLSKGTKHSIDIAKKLKRFVHVYDFKGDLMDGAINERK